MMLIVFFISLIVLFLWGMYLIRKGLAALTSEKIEKSLLLFTDHPLKAFLISILFTGVLQSSSAFMVIAIGLVSAGALTFKQAIPMVLGTNVGSTFTTQFLAVRLEYLILPLILFGVLLVITGNQKFKSLGTSFLGLGLIFLCIDSFSALAGPISKNELGALMIQISNESIWHSFFFGAIFTAIIHSSSVCISVIMGLMNGGVFQLINAFAVVLGSNVGTCITAVMASARGGQAARQTSLTHVLFNVAGVLLAFPFLPQFLQSIYFLSSNPAQQIAHFSLLFNLFTALIVLPFTGYIHRVVAFIVK
ncbi:MULTISPECIES: Na/Pi symporter [Bacillus]|uniref:Na/Pi cotransporter n=2 Tax=Bacillus TaxID=1386 RepID=A0A0M4FQV0_9BACI|nr:MULTISPECIES: Na/Pi symporter [Bacillus]ALC81673.1 hypothetical protein AM592_08680 [Bacillus gobiensis]MBP1080723.1 phosphate:Na+ symporter [Bacillus capparidis]MED1094579.1 Na/Pi symporter [Bacillus capparidis]